MIPKTIHYCWFGGNPLPRSAQKCISSWRKFFPDYEIKEWNEGNYDISKIPYIRQAYEAKKYAFVSDYARFDILCQYGGVYFDTDVEVIKPFDDILETGAFMGCERDGVVSNEIKIDVAPGLGLAAEPGLQLYREILDLYETLKFLQPDGSQNTKTVGEYTTNVLKLNGLKDINGIQNIEGITIYPKEYFNPFDNATGKLTITENTHSIHWYSKSWMDKKTVFISKFARPFHRLFGNGCFNWLRGK